MPSSARSSRRWRAVTASNCAASARSPSRIVRPAPVAIPALERTCRWRRSPCRSSRPARKCASGSTARARDAMIRKIVTALILVPLAIVFIALAVANRQPVLVSFDPFDQINPAFARALPLYALMLILVIAGVAVGGIAAWVMQGKWRRAARLADAQARELRAEVGRLRRRYGRLRVFPGLAESCGLRDGPRARRAGAGEGAKGCAVRRCQRR